MPNRLTQNPGEPCNRVLLLGAGFSRNWGGYLASQLFDKIAAHKELNENLRDLLFENKNNFEDALSELQNQVAQDQNNESAKESLKNLTRAVYDVFLEMDNGFRDVSFEPQNMPGGRGSTWPIAQFLGKFDAIFTLNQDCLLERHYFTKNVQFITPRWKGWSIPGVDFKPNNSFHPNPIGLSVGVAHLQLLRKVDKNKQPYFKLHGSYNWVDDQDLLFVVGGRKAKYIESCPLLKSYFEEFEERLRRPNTKLVVVGYGFRDEHVNRILSDACVHSPLKVLVNDPHYSQLFELAGTMGVSEGFFKKTFAIGMSSTLLEIFEKKGPSYDGLTKFLA